jgi:glutamate racemase
LSNNNPIGVFDSGVGGLSVVRRMRERLPQESIVYIGDTAHVPYGSKSAEELLELGERIVSFLINKGAKVIVAACNTSCAVSIPIISKNTTVPIIPVIDPGAELAARRTRSRRVGVIATQATVASGAYPRAMRRVDSQIEVFQSPCPAFVPLIEQGILEGPEIESAARQYLAPLTEARIDTLVLGCTHYPYLVPILKKFLPENVEIVDPADPTAEDLVKVLGHYELFSSNKTGTSQYYASGSTRSFYDVGRRLGANIDEVLTAEVD